MFLELTVGDQKKSTQSRRKLLFLLNTILNINHKIIKKALLIRNVEQSILNLLSTVNLNRGVQELNSKSDFTH